MMKGQRVGTVFDLSLPHAYMLALGRVSKPTDLDYHHLTFAVMGWVYVDSVSVQLL
jgi:hypothetical protein